MMPAAPPPDSDRSTRWARAVAERHRDDLLRHAKIQLGNRRDEAEDVVQDLLLDLCSGRFADRKVPPGKTLAFLKGVVRNRARDRCRRYRPIGLTEALHVANDGNAWREAHRIKTRQALGRALRTLPKHQRRMVIRHHLHGWSTKDLAVAEGIQPGSVRKRLERARRRLAKIVGYSKRS